MYFNFHKETHYHKSSLKRAVTFYFCVTNRVYASGATERRAREHIFVWDSTGQSNVSVFSFCIMAYN